MAPPRKFSAAEKGKARQVESSSPPPKRGRGRPRKHPVASWAASRGRGGGPLRSDERLAMVGGRVPAVRPPRTRLHTVEVLAEFIVWAVEPTGARLLLPRFLLGELPAGALGGL